MLHCSRLCSLVFVAHLLVTMMKLPVLCSLLKNRVVLRGKKVWASFHERPWLKITCNGYL